MSKIIQLTADDAGKDKFWINADQIITMARDNFNGTTKIIVGNMAFGVTESPEEIIGMINPH